VPGIFWCAVGFLGEVRGGVEDIVEDEEELEEVGLLANSEGCSTVNGMDVIVEEEDDDDEAATSSLFSS
jgi:hypothetical protein